MNNNQYFFKLQETFYTCFLFFLVLICLLNSGLFSIEYIITLKKNESILLVGKFLFFVCVLVQLFIPQKSLCPYIVSLFLSDAMLNYCNNTVIFFENSKKNHPFSTFLIMYLYICVFLLYWFTHLLQQDDLFRTFFYCIFNILKLFFLPIFILSFILINNRFLMIPEVVTHLSKMDIEQITKTAKSTVKFLKQGVQNNPKTAALVGAVAAATAGFNLQGSVTKDLINDHLKNPDYPFMNWERYNQWEKTPESEKLFRISIDILSQSRKKPLVIGFHDFLSFLKKEPTLAQQFRTSVELTIDLLATGSPVDRESLFDQAREQAILEMRNQQMASLEGSPVSRSLSESDEVPGSAVIPKSSVDIPSCVEHTFFSL
jgi:hypothetical protein